MRPIPILAFAIVAVSLVARDSWAQSVWVVDKAGGPGSNFTEIQPAINAATDHDIVLVRAGSYGPVSIAGKGISVVADAGVQGAVTTGSYSISNTSSSQPVVLRGLTGYFLSAKNLAGPLWIEGHHTIPSATLLAIAGMSLENCASVTIVRSQVFGASVAYYPPSVALSSQGSNVSAYGSVFHGGDAGYHVSSGASGCVGSGSFFASRCVFQGGNAGIYGLPNLGGNGLEWGGGNPEVSLNCQFIGGAANSPGGIPGKPLVVDSQFQVLTGPNFTYAVDSPVREQQAIAFHFQCDVAADTYLFTSPDPGLALDIPGIHGPLLLDLAALGYVPFGVLAPGPTTVSIPIGDLPPTVSGFTLATQAIFIDPNFSFLEVGAPSHLVILDASL